MNAVDVLRDAIDQRKDVDAAREALDRLARLVEADKALRDSTAASDHPERYLALKEVAEALSAVLGEGE